MSVPSKSANAHRRVPPASPQEGRDRAASPPLDTDIGSRLRSIRRAYGLSQRELAKRVGVTNGTISLIEQNKVSPTIASLRKVLSGFPLTLADFFAGDVPRAPKIFFRASDLPEIRGDGLTLRQVGPTSPKRRLQVLHEHYDVGGDTGEELLAHDGEEAGVVVRGRVEITVGGQTEVLGPGDAYAFDSRIPHRFRNVGRKPCEVVSACTPPTF